MTTEDHVKMHVTRRRFVKSLGATALAAPFLRPRAAEAATPTNLVVVTWPEGLETGWQPTGGGATYEFKDVLAPLNPFRAKLLAVNGVKGGTGNIILQHSEGTCSMWTGAIPKSGLGPLLSPRPSFDQVVAGKIGMGTPYKSLHFGTQTNRKSFISTPYVHYAGPQQPIPAEDDPATLYKLIFGGLSADAAALDRLRAERKSVLELVSVRLKTLRPQVAASDRVKLDKHEESIRAIERSFDGMNSRCAPMPAPTLTAAAALTDENFPAVIKLQTDLLATALQCGITRVATLQLSNTDSQTRIPGLVTKRTVHDAMHSGTTAERVEINRFFAKQLAYVLERLQAVDVAPGRTLLDDTLVVMSSEMAVGGHWNDPIPFLIAGNGGGYLKLGRYVNVPGRPRHTKVLTALVHTFGLTDIPTYGEFTGSDAEGPLAELRG